MSLKDFTGCDVRYVHVTHQAQMHFDFNKFDVLFHSDSARLSFDGYLSADYERAVAAFRGLKIAVVQDDYDRTIALHRAIRRLGFHVVLTSIQKDFWPLVYPKCQVPGVRLVQVLTGYVPASIPVKDDEILPLRERPVWVAYRGRDIGAKYGRLGFEKYEIGRRMIEICEAQNIPHDIAMDDTSRIYGDDWFRFLGRSRTMLGSESGSNAFDFDGSIEERCNEFVATQGRRPTYPELAEFLQPFERPFDVGQISPRIFECAMMRTPMILFRGRYSDIIEPGIHYIPLEKDFSNAAGILSRLGDVDFLQGFSDQAYSRLIASGNYSYKALAKLISDVIEEQHSLFENDPFVRHRNRTAEPWKPPPVVEAVKRPEDAVQIALAENATEYPQSVAEFTAKQEAFVELLRKLSMPAPAAEENSILTLKRLPRRLASAARARAGAIGARLPFVRDS